MSENEYFLDSRMCWMASWTAGSIPWLMLLIRADSFMGIRTMMGKFSPSLANQLLSCPCLLRSLHTLASAGWNNKTERSRHPVGRNISQPPQSLRAEAMRLCRVTNWEPTVPSLFGHCKFVLVRDAQAPVRQGKPILKQSGRESCSCPCSGQTGCMDYDDKLKWILRLCNGEKNIPRAQRFALQKESYWLGVRHPNDLLSKQPLSFNTPSHLWCEHVS